MIKNIVESKNRIYFKVICVFMYFFLLLLHLSLHRQHFCDKYTIYTPFLYIALSSVIFFCILFTSPGPLCSICVSTCPHIYWGINQIYGQETVLFKIGMIGLHPHKCFLLFLKVFLVGLRNDFIYVSVYICLRIY